MSARKPHRPPDVGWRPRGGGAPTRTVRRPRVRAVLRALLWWLILLLGLLPACAAAGVPEPSAPVRSALAVGMVLLFALPLRSELRTSVGLRNRELVVTNAFTRRTLSSEDIRSVKYASGLHQRERLELSLVSGRWVTLCVSVGLSPQRRTELCDLLHDWARANRVHTDFRVLGPKHRWSD
ncbi:hypothetical protein [Kitasatospora sp. NA04385]|uniref:hypothetical protein n=1 Tax=Kitasatospora sp. NA04385 TaxID=2742135 RepID=UPI001C378DDF|nr:hypothetical protein [Kitasatospora sp. NA04385]